VLQRALESALIHWPQDIRRCANKAGPGRSENREPVVRSWVPRNRLRPSCERHFCVHFSRSADAGLCLFIAAPVSSRIKN
jgi:hypothetical protein